MKKLYIVGSGGFGREVLWLVRRINRAAVERGCNPFWDIVGFIDDNPLFQGMIQDDCPIIGDCNYLGNLDMDVYVVIAIGTSSVRKQVAEKLSNYNHVHLATLVDPSVIFSERVELGDGCIICAGSILTVGIKIGNHVIINLDCTIGHDSVIGDYVTIYPSVNISGNVQIGEETELGTGTQIIQGKRIGKRSILGAGAVVVRDIADRCMAVGSPAKTVKFFDLG